MNLQEQLEKMTMQIAAGVGGILALLYFFVMYDGGGNIKENITAAEQQLATAETELSKLAPLISQADKLKKEYETYKSKSEMVLRFFPEKYDGVELRQLLTDAAKSIGLNVSKINQENMYSGAQTDKDKQFDEVTVSISTQGNFTQLMELLSSLTRSKIVLVAKNIKIRTEMARAEQAQPTLTFDGRFTVYKQIPLAANKPPQ